MHSATKKILVGLPALAVTLALLFVAVPASAQLPGPFVIDHYYVYALNVPITGVFPMRLTDQFGTADGVAEILERFAIPVDKNGEGILDPSLHYTWWRISGDLASPIPLVAVENQFGAHTLNVGNAAYLLNPALKNPLVGEQFPLGKDHYKCYDVTGDPLAIPVSLSHQFGTEITDVFMPHYLCNPVEKGLPDNTVYPIVNPDDHLVCYQIQPGVPISGIVVGVLDQFVDVTVEPIQPELICVPSTKEIPTQASEESWGSLKAIYR
jgi:hypothetical protein